MIITNLITGLVIGVSAIIAMSIITRLFCGDKEKSKETEKTES